jgi:hypothetical protein
MVGKRYHDRMVLFWREVALRGIRRCAVLPLPIVSIPFIIKETYPPEGEADKGD